MICDLLATLCELCSLLSVLYSHSLSVHVVSFVCIQHVIILTANQCMVSPKWHDSLSIVEAVRAAGVGPEGAVCRGDYRRVVRVGTRPWRIYKAKATLTRCPADAHTKAQACNAHTEHGTQSTERENQRMSMRIDLGLEYRDRIRE